MIHKYTAFFVFSMHERDEFPTTFALSDINECFLGVIAFENFDFYFSILSS